MRSPAREKKRGEREKGATAAGRRRGELTVARVDEEEEGDDCSSLADGLEGLGLRGKVVAVDVDEDG